MYYGLLWIMDKYIYIYIYNTLELDMLNIIYVPFSEQNLVDDLFVWNVQLRLLELLQPGSAADSSRVYIYWPRAFRWAIQMKTPGSRFDWNPARTRHRDLAKVQMVWCGPMGPVFDYGLGLVNLSEIQDPFGSWSLYDFADCEVCLCVRVFVRFDSAVQGKTRVIILEIEGSMWHVSAFAFFKICSNSRTME